MKTKIFTVLAICSITLFSCKKDEPTTASTNTTNTTATTTLTANEITFYTELLKELNNIRTNPSKYADDVLLVYKNKNTDNGAYDDIKGRAPVGALSENAFLNTACRDYAKVLADTKIFSHSADGTTGLSRTTKAGYKGTYYNENLLQWQGNNANINVNAKTTALYFIDLWVIDAGVVGVGHRNAIFNGTYDEVGMGYYAASPNFYCVLNFGKK